MLKKMDEKTIEETYLDLTRYEKEKRKIRVGPQCNLVRLVTILLKKNIFFPF